jgi:tetratricopeptide (TPR) repeat protein
MQFLDDDEHWDVTQHSIAESFNFIANMIDISADEARTDWARKALELCETASGLELSMSEQVELNYFRANAWSSIRAATHQDEVGGWVWHQSELIHEIYWLRAAICHDGFREINTFRQCQILTNTGNLLSYIGRPIEAIEYWHRALSIVPNFAMALGNLGLGLKTYGHYLYDFGHACLIFKSSYSFLISASRDGSIWDSEDHYFIKNMMISTAEEIASNINLELITDIDKQLFSLGRSKGEKSYRNWVLENGLFLSPLNDLGDYSIAAHDIFHLPSMVFAFGESPSLIGLFNQMKQEYISARFFYWQGLGSEEKNYSDRNVLLIDTLDYPLYSVYIEQIKIAFRMAYSIFDKIAFFINYYWQLEVPEKSINFQSIWFETKNKERSLRPCFITSQNLPLRGLFWLSKDFLEEKDLAASKNDNAPPDLASVMEPDAYALRKIRNHIEHKYLKVHDFLWEISSRYQTADDPFKDRMAYSITLEVLESKTHRLLKLARSGLIYLSLAVHREERMRSMNRNDELIAPMYLPPWKM